MISSSRDGQPTAEQVFEVFKAYARNEVGERQARRRVVAFLAGDTLADFVCENIVLAALVRGLADASVTVIHAATEPERAFVVGCNPCVGGTMAVEPGTPFTALLDWFDVGIDAPMRCPEPAWQGRGLGAPDVLLVPGSLGACPAHLTGLAEAPPVFRLPKGADDPSALIARGVGPETWFAGVHGLDAETLGGFEHAVRGQGGVVVPLDDAPLADRATVLIHARFVIGSDATLAALASGFRVPSVFLGRAERRWPVWNREDVLVADGVGAPEDVKALIGHMVALTAGCAGWRSPVDEIAAEPVDGIVLPPPVRETPLCQVWPAGAA